MLIGFAGLNKEESDFILRTAMDEASTPSSTAKLLFSIRMDGISLKPSSASQVSI